MQAPERYGKILIYYDATHFLLYILGIMGCVVVYIVSLQAAP